MCRCKVYRRRIANEHFTQLTKLYKNFNQLSKLRFVTFESSILTKGINDWENAVCCSALKHDFFVEAWILKIKLYP